MKLIALMTNLYETNVPAYLINLVELPNRSIVAVGDNFYVFVGAGIPNMVGV